MTDPERISKRRAGLAAQLLQAGAAELPSDAGIARTLQALGVSAAILSTTSATSAAAGSAKVTGVATVGAGAAAGSAGVAAGGTAKAVSGVLLVKWIGIGVVGGVGLAGAAAVATAPSGAKHAAATAVASAPPVVVAVAPGVELAARPKDVVAAPAPAAPAVVAAPAARSITASAEPAPPEASDVAPLAAEVSFVDQARALLTSGQAEQGLAMLQGYERQFPEARLLPEVLFMRLETCERLGRTSEARAAAQRLVDSYPKSPHASRARKLLGQ